MLTGLTILPQTLTKQRINWDLPPALTPQQVKVILPSLQAWQLGETSDGHTLIKAANRYAWRTSDADYVKAVELFIKEEQKHGENLGRYLDALHQPRIKKNLGDSLFRWMRHFNTSMEAWTLVVVTVESTAQIFYQALKDATNCELLKHICTDILIDEAYHITFQTDRLAVIYDNRSAWGKTWRKYFYQSFFYGTAIVVWAAHHQLFRAGGNTFKGYIKKMHHKYLKTLNQITTLHLFEVA
ncbi:ferritin-like domain-containing protein [Mucilaginibacter sp. PAMB04274]|uniref:ferritin-like domain-containing protein n=1 Tax=Mucilaginibacter sp. PAMB04274 TaxID=3138568 RepID=UPI0031F6655C